MNIIPGETVTLTITFTVSSVTHHEEHGGFTAMTYVAPDVEGEFTLEVSDAMLFGIRVDHAYDDRTHRGDCGTHNEPALAPRPCDCKR